MQKTMMTGMTDVNEALKQLQNMPDVQEALKQERKAQEMIADQIKQAMAQHGKVAVKRGNTSSQQEAPNSNTAGKSGHSDISFTRISADPLLKWIDDKYVEFGSYPQAADGGVKKIIWRVLENKDGHLLLLSKDILEYRSWHNSSTRRAESHPKTWKKDDVLAAMIPWEACDARTWLNGYFYENAFHTAEKNIIVERLNTGNGAYMHHDYVPKILHKMNVNALTTDSYANYEERGCRDTKDHVFLLSVKEALDYFGKSYIVPGTVWAANMDRLAKPTDYMMQRGFYYYNGDKASFSPITLRETFYRDKGKHITFPEFYGHTAYWLRSAGSNDLAMNMGNCPFHCGQLSFVSDIGTVCAGGWSPASLGCGIRPAIVIKNQ